MNSENVKTFAQVRKHLERAGWAILYSDGTLVFTVDNVVKVPGKRESQVVQVRYRVKGYIKDAAHSWETHYGPYNPFTDSSGSKNRPLRISFRDDALGLVALARPRYVTVYLRNNSSRVDQLGLENRTVQLAYQGTRLRTQTSYLAYPEGQSGYRTLADVLVSTEVEVQWDLRAERPEEIEYDQDWVMDDYAAVDPSIKDRDERDREYERNAKEQS